jgi:hypothetical protein
VTDFFGGVASVEVLNSEAKLPLRSKPSPWRKVSRRKTIGSSDVTPKTIKVVQPRTARTREGGWSNPLQQGSSALSTIIGGLTVASIAALLFSRLAAESR